MAKATGFLEIDREETKSILPEDRVKNLRNSYYHPQTKKFLKQPHAVWIVVFHFVIMAVQSII